MNSPESSPKRHGFRFSIGDAVILAAGLGLTLWLHAIDFPLWWIVAMAVGHFFLFCNVFLVWRRWELLWAAVFVINVGLHLANGCFTWLSPLLWQLPWTIVIIALQRISDSKGLPKPAWLSPRPGPFRWRPLLPSGASSNGP